MELGNKGDCFQQLDQLEDALNAYTEAINLKDDNGTFYLNRALIYGKKGDYQVI